MTWLNVSLLWFNDIQAYLLSSGNSYYAKIPLEPSVSFCPFCFSVGSSWWTSLEKRTRREGRCCLMSNLWETTCQLACLTFLCRTSRAPASPSWRTKSVGRKRMASLTLPQLLFPPSARSSPTAMLSQIHSRSISLQEWKRNLNSKHSLHQNQTCSVTSRSPCLRWGLCPRRIHLSVAAAHLALMLTLQKVTLCLSAQCVLSVYSAQRK